MNSIVRFFNRDDESPIMRFENVIVPQINSVVFLYDEPYRVRDITYDYERDGSESLIDISVDKIIGNLCC
jgi:hypothetical protein